MWNFANVLLNFDRVNAASRVSSWLDRFNGMPVYFGVVEVSDKVKALPAREFEIELQKRVSLEGETRKPPRSRARV